MNRRILIRDVIFDGETSDILIEGNVFKNLHAPAGETADIIINGQNKAILPALYNAHTHSAMTLLRGYADDMPLFPWLTDYIWPYEARMQKEDIYAGSRLAILEMIKSGCVFFSDMYWNIEETMRAVEEMGVRAAIGVTLMDRMSEEAKEKNFRFIETWSDRTSGRLQITVAPHAVYTVGEALLRRCSECARRKGIQLHIHLSETEQEVKDCIAAHGTTPVRWLQSLGVLDGNVVAAHVLHVDDEEIEILRQHNVIIAHNPCSNMKLSSGVFRLQALMKSGCRIVLGTDGCSSNNNLDMREEMKMAALLAKYKGNTESLPANKVFEWGTRNGAEAFGINAGLIKEGMLADAILIDLDNERLVPCHNLISNWVYSADSRCIDTVICDGKILMQNGTVENEQEIIEEARKACRRLHAKS